MEKRGLEIFKRISFRWATIPTLMLCLSITNCTQKETSKNNVDRPVPVTRNTSDGSVSLSFSVSPEQLTRGQRASIEITIEARQGVTVEMDDYGYALKEGDRAFEYHVVHSEKKEAVPVEDGTLRWTYRYELDFFLSGTYELPAPFVAYYEQPIASVTELSALPDHLSELTTETITLVVTEPADAALSEQELTNIKTLDPIELIKPWSRWWWFAPVFAAIVITLLVLWLRKIRRQRLERLAAPLPADIWAYREIATLVADDLLSKGRIQEFYYRTSGIVRGYIERRFFVHAPEMTTEEFLETAKTDHRFEENHTQELTHFMDACDLVKYARQVPTQNEADQILSTAKRFIETTRPRAIEFDSPDAKAPTEQECVA